MLKVVKIGGNIVDDHAKLERFLCDFAALEGEKILVHGGGKIATSISRALDIEAIMIDGRRVTDEETLKVVTMVYAGLINKNIVRMLISLGGRAIGLSGVDGSFIVSERREAVPIDYGLVGDPVEINTELADELLRTGYVIVAAPITIQLGGGALLNTNADTVARTIAVGMARAGREVELRYCFEKKGVLFDINDDDSVIESIDAAKFEQLKANGAVTGGMLPKLENAFRAIEEGVSQVVICSAESLSGGTLIH